MKKCKDCYYGQKMKDGKLVCQVCQMEDEIEFSDDFRICKNIKDCKHFSDIFQYLPISEKRNYEYVYVDEYNFLDNEKITRAEKFFPCREAYLRCENSEEKFKEVFHQLEENKVEIIACANYHKKNKYILTEDRIMIRVVADGEVSLLERQFATQAFGFPEKDRDFLCFDSEEEKFNGTWLEYVLNINKGGQVMKDYKVLLTFGRTEITLDKIFAESEEAALIIAGMRLNKDGIEIKDRKSDKIEVVYENQE